MHLTYYYHLLLFMFASCIISNRQPCYRVAVAVVLATEVMLVEMFTFQDMMSFGMFLLALLTFIFMTRK